MQSYNDKARRTIAIGDIHGCSQALAALIEAIQPGSQDEIVPLGDYLDKGPDSRGVIDQLMALAGRCRLIPLMGNHEEMVLAGMDSRSERDFWLKSGGTQTLESHGGRTWPTILSTHIGFIKSCRPYYETDSHIFVHANYYPSHPMASHSSNVLYWVPLEPERAAPHHSGKTVVVGHTPQTGGDILDLGFLKCIDTNCWQGGWLTALEVATGQVWRANQRGEVVQERLGYRPTQL